MAGIIKFPGHILAVALAIGWLFDLLFWGRLPGVSVLMFVLTLVLALMWLGKLGDVTPVKHNLWLVAPLVFFAGMVAVRANGFLVFLDVLACLVLLALLAYFFAAGRVERVGLVGYWFVLMEAGLNALFRAAPLLPATLGASKVPGAGKQRLHRMLPVLRGLVIALPVAIVFVGLLASADLVFAQYVGALLTFGYLPDMQAFLWQTLLALFVAWLAAGGLVLALTRRDADNNEPWEAAMSKLPKVLHIGFVESVTVLVVVDVIFLLFGWIQFSYLFGGQSNISVDGYTYADYARRGFFELIAVSMLTMGLILGLHWLTWRETGRQSVVFKVLASLMAGLSLVLLASAFYRMGLYEDAYGYTYLRLYVHVFEVWLGGLFGWLLVTLWWKPRRFAIGCFAAAIGFLVTLNAINPDALIVEENLARYSATGNIDAAYLAGLSEDGIPSLLDGVDRLKGNEKDWVLYSLKEKLGSMTGNSGWRDMVSFNLSRQQAYDALVQNEARLAQAKMPYYRPGAENGGNLGWLDER